MTVQLHTLAPNLMVEDVERTITFYRDVLGFQVSATAPATAPFDWASLTHDGVEVMLQSRSSLEGEYTPLHGHSIGGSLTFFIEVNDARALHEQIQKKVTIVQELHRTFYGMLEFAIQDPNGYILCFAEKV